MDSVVPARNNVAGSVDLQCPVRDFRAENTNAAKFTSLRPRPRPLLRSRSPQVERAVAAGEAERFVAVSDAPVPDAFDSETNWPACAKTIGDIRDQVCMTRWPWRGPFAVTFAVSRPPVTSATRGV